MKTIPLEYVVQGEPLDVKYIAGAEGLLATALRQQENEDTTV